MILELSALGATVAIAVATSVLVNRSFPPTPREPREVGEREITALRKQIEELLDTVEDIQRGKRERDSEIAQLRVMLASLQDENEKLRVENRALQSEIAELRTLYMRTRRGF
jgi:predicted RNase H-like nuclease (RuvC/YqgF family)